MKKKTLLFAWAAFAFHIAAGQGGCATSFTYNPVPCPSFFFDPLSAIPVGTQITGYAWTFGDGGTSSLMQPTHTYSANGNYQVCVTITLNNGCQATDCQSILVSCLSGGSACNASFQWAFGLGGCPNVSFANLSSASPGSIVSNSWNFGDGNSSAIQNPGHIYSANGNFAVCLTIITSDSCTDTFCDTVAIACFPTPVCNANFLWTYSSNGCPEILVNSTSTASPGTVASWAWDFGDGGTGFLQNDNHSFVFNGAYPVCLTIVSTDSCTDIYCDTIHVTCIQAACSAAFAWSFSTDGCPEVDFSDSSFASPGTIAAWNWSFGDGGNSSTQNSTHTYSFDSSYLVCLDILTSDSCTSQFCDTVDINCISGIESADMGLVKFVLYPNPAEESFRIRFEISQFREISWEMFGTDGKRIWMEKSKGFHPGSHEILIPFAESAKGSYLFVFKLDETISARQFLSIR